MVGRGACCPVLGGWSCWTLHPLFLHGFKVCATELRWGLAGKIWWVKLIHITSHAHWHCTYTAWEPMHLEVPHTTINNHTQHIIRQRFTLLDYVAFADLVLKGSNIQSCPNCCDFSSLTGAAASPPRPPSLENLQTLIETDNFFFSLAAILVYFYFWISIVNTKYAQKQ